MSKEVAMSMLTGTPVTTVNPSLVTGAIPTTEAGPTVDTPKPETPKGLDSDRFAKLAAQEAKLVKERESLKAERAAVESEKAKAKEILTRDEEFENLKKTDKIAAMKRLGFTEEDIFNYLAGQDAPKEPTTEEKAAAAAQAEIKKFQDEQLEKEKKRQAEVDEKALRAYRDGITQTISKEAEKYEYCNYHGAIAEEIIYETILGFIKDDNELTPHQAMVEAIEAVEKMYEEEDKQMSSKLKKRQTAPTPAPEPQKTPVQKTPTQKARTGQATITNRATATVASHATTKESPDAKRERLKSWLRTGQKPA